MLKIGSCTVLYNPDKDIIRNIYTYANCVDVCVVVDNSDKKNEASNQLKEDQNIVYIDMFSNLGIAAALNRGIEFLQKQGMEFVLTMDQDSQFPTKYWDEILELVERKKKDYSLIGLNFNQSNEPSCKDIVDVPYCITSGNFLNIHDFMQVGRFREELFIDYVDFDLGYKLNKANFKVGYLKGFSIIHTIGSPIEIHIFNKTYYALNHASIRYYYRYRNSYYMYKLDSHFFRKAFFKEMFFTTAKLLIFEKNRKEKLKMVVKGIQDAKNNRLGKYTRG